MKKAIFTGLPILIILGIILSFGCHGRGPSPIEHEWPLISDETQPSVPHEEVGEIEVPHEGEIPPEEKEDEGDEGKDEDKEGGGDETEFTKVECPTTKGQYKIFNAFKIDEMTDYEVGKGDTKIGIPPIPPSSHIGGMVRSISTFKDKETNKEVLISAVGSTIIIGKDKDDFVTLPYLVNDLASEYFGDRLIVAAATKYALFTLGLKKQDEKWKLEGELRQLPIYGTGRVFIAKSPRHYLNTAAGNEDDASAIKETTYIYFSRLDAPTLYRIEPEMVEGGCIEKVYQAPTSPEKTEIKKMILEGNHLAVLVKEEISHVNFIRNLFPSVPDDSSLMDVPKSLVGKFRETELKDQMASLIAGLSKTVILSTKVQVIDLNSGESSAPTLTIPNITDKHILDISADESRILTTIFTYNYSKLEEKFEGQPHKKEQMFKETALMAAMPGASLPQEDYYKSLHLYVTANKWDSLIDTPTITEIETPASQKPEEKGIPPAIINTSIGNSKLLLKGCGGYHGIYNITDNSLNKHKIEYLTGEQTVPATKIMYSDDTFLTLISAMNRFTEKDTWPAVQYINTDGDMLSTVSNHQIMPNPIISTLDQMSIYPFYWIPSFGSGNMALLLEKGEESNEPYGKTTIISPYIPDDLKNENLDQLQYKFIEYDGSRYIFQIIVKNQFSTNFSLRDINDLNKEPFKTFSVSFPNYEIEIVDITQLNENLFILAKSKHAIIPDIHTTDFLKLPLTANWDQNPITASSISTELQVGRLAKSFSSGKYAYLTLNGRIARANTEKMPGVIEIIVIPDLTDIKDLYVRHGYGTDTDLLIAVTTGDVHAYSYNHATTTATLVEGQPIPTTGISEAEFYHSPGKLFLRVSRGEDFSSVYSVLDYDDSNKIKLQGVQLGDFLDMDTTGNFLLLNTSENGVKYFDAGGLLK